jgi:hypothetical protein
MAIRLKIHEDKVRLKVGQGDTVRLKASEGVPVYPPAYEGATEVIPSAEEQVLLTGGMYVEEDIRVKPVPSNYGLITWNGSTLTVS